MSSSVAVDHARRSEETGASPGNRIEGLGAHIRGARIQRGMSAASLAREVGVSPSLISQIERRVTSPSIEVLWAIARALDVSMGAFFQDTRATPGTVPAASPSRAVVVRANARKRLALPNSVSYDLLSPDLKHQIEFTWAEFAPGEESPQEPYSHVGEEQMVVIEGEVHFWIDGEEIVLGEGDALTIDSGLPHRAANRGTRRAIMIAAMTPPSF
jgi:transcriptional regulator with XRE-family HTH domain